MPDAKATVEQLREHVAAFVRSRDWGKYHTPRNIAASISVEAAEMLELFQWEEPDMRHPKAREALEDELADVFVYCLSMANAIGCDLSDITLRKLGKNEVRYPAEQYRGSAAKAPQTSPRPPRTRSHRGPRT